MAQISLYVDDGVLDSPKQRAAAEDISVSKLTARIIEADRCSSVWPNGWFDLYGSVSGFPDTDDSILDPSLDDACDWFVGETFEEVQGTCTCSIQTSS